MLPMRNVGTRSGSDYALQAKRLLDETGGSSIVVITSAFHMRRALGEAKAAGIDAHAFPADFEIPAGGRPWFQLYLPTADALRLASIVIKEWGGLAMQRWGG